ncbi:MAG: ABC transporter substrate-binding protein, partial [Rhodospirillales bacterium]|nr:ABC transporter substrate-binding protein [Rhodospirillales bacterium]
MHADTLARRRFFRLAATGLFATALPAAAFPTLGHAQAAAAPTDPIRALDAALLQAMKTGRSASFAERYEMLSGPVDQAFDLDAVLQTSVGPRWATLSATERDELRSAFRRYTIANYVANFDSYEGQQFQLDPAPRSLPGGQQVVTTRLVAPGGSTTVLGYVMRQTPSGWKAVDVLADGAISRVAVQRS